jgi:hypothetical protein
VNSSLQRKVDKEQLQVLMDSKMSLELFEDEKNGIYQKIDNISRDLGTLSNKIVKRHEFD